MSENQKLVRKQLIEDLNSKDEDTVLAAISRCKSLGDAEMIPQLLDIYIAADSESPVGIEMQEMLYTMKDKRVIEPLVEALDEKRFIPHRAKIIPILWNAGFEPKDHLSTFVRIALEGNFMEALECLTLIENLEDPLPEEELMDALIQLKDYFSDKNHEQEDKYDLIRTIATIVKYTDDNQII